MASVLTIAAFITDFADQAVVLPLAILVAAFLYVSGWRRGALVWSSVIVATFALMLLLKILFGACGHLISNAEIESPSGHTAAAGVVYGSIVAYLVERLFGRTILTFVMILAVVALVGLSRVLLGAHTIPEVGVGAVVGLVAAMLLVRGAGQPARASRLGYLLLPACAVLFLLHGLHLPAEAAIRSYAQDNWLSQACRSSEGSPYVGSSSSAAVLPIAALRHDTTSRPRQGFAI